MTKSNVRTIGMTGWEPEDCLRAALAECARDRANGLEPAVAVIVTTDAGADRRLYKSSMDTTELAAMSTLLQVTVLEKFGLETMLVGREPLDEPEDSG